jgi:hypothetical protein
VSEDWRLSTMLKIVEIHFSMSATFGAAADNCHF